MEMINCGWCKKEFKKNKYNKLFCSILCRINAKKEYCENYNKHHSNYTKLRFLIFKRDEFRCIYCGKSPIEDGIKLEVDHISPRIQTNLSLEQCIKQDPSMVVTACSDCNLGKNKNILSEDIIKRIITKTKIQINIPPINIK